MAQDDIQYWSIFKIILLGDSGVGKSNILNRLVNDKFSLETKSTVGVEFGAKQYTIDGNLIKAQIWDTAGQERFRAITAAYYKGAYGAVLTYDITRQSSFQSLEKWIDDFYQYAEEGALIIIIGNKCDLESHRQVTTQQGLEWATARGYAFMETSAKDKINVDAAFEKLIQEIYAQLGDDDEEDTQNGQKEIQKPIQAESVKLEKGNNKTEQTEKSGCC